MPPRPPQRGLRFPACAWLALVALAGIAPATAEAGCAGHASGRPDTATFLANLADLQILRQSAGVDSPAPVPTPPPSRPCSGPSCSGLPPIPTPASTVQAPPGAGQWMLPTAAPAPPGEATGRFPAREGSAHACSRGEPADRPPRAASSRLAS